MDVRQYNRQLFAFLDNSTTAFHAATNIAQTLQQAGFARLAEGANWELQSGHGYYVVRDQGAVVAFILGENEQPEDGFRILAAHTDSPCLQVKPRPEVVNASYLQLGVETYGGSLLRPWFDRTLGLAGRVSCLLDDGNLHSLLLDFGKPLVTVPSIAIHFDREANKTAALNQQKHLPPVLFQSASQEPPDFKQVLVDQLHKQYPQICLQELLAWDLFCYDAQPSCMLGLSDSLISAPRLDNLLSCHAALQALSRSERQRNVLAFFANHEEIGSTSVSGAQSSFLSAIFQRIYDTGEGLRRGMSNSFLLSMDNAHAVHPNYPEMMENKHEILLNKGPVLKINANQRYATNAISAGLVKLLCRDAGIQYQEFVMRSDLACGSTVGPMTAARLGVLTADVGAATLAMHSIRELTGEQDPTMLFRLASQFCSSDRHRSLRQ